MCPGDSGGSSQGSSLVGVTTLNTQTAFLPQKALLDAQHSMTDHPQPSIFIKYFSKVKREEVAQENSLKLLLIGINSPIPPAGGRTGSWHKPTSPETKHFSQGKGEGDSNRLQSFCFHLEKGATVDRPELFLHKQMRGKSLILYKLQTGLLKCTTISKCTTTAALSNEHLLCCQLPPTQALLQ